MNIAIFASGTGTNAQKIIEHFAQHPSIEVRLIVSNKATAAVLHKAKAANINTWLLHRHTFYKTTDILEKLHSYSIDFIVLAGFLWLIPSYLVKAFDGRMINIHPALLPKFGGKGMYGMNVHRAVKQAGEKESGITIHYINEEYDEGNIIFQAKCTLIETDTAEDIAIKVRQLEHHYFPQVIEKIAIEQLKR